MVRPRRLILRARLWRMDNAPRSSEDDSLRRPRRLNSSPVSYTVFSMVVVIIVGLLGLTFLRSWHIPTPSSRSVRDLTVSSSFSSLTKINDVHRPPRSKKAHIHQEACQKLNTVRDIQTCYPKHAKKFTDPQCQALQTWNEIQHCLFGRFQYNGTYNDIREVHILGERNSGTKFITSSLQQCFPKSTTGIKVHRDLVRPKHFFQPLLLDRDFSHSLVLVVVRDPFEWMAAMRELPYHSPHHVAGFDPDTGAVRPLPWQEFVARPWTTHSSRIAPPEESDVDCTYHFSPQEVQPCRLDNVTAQRPPWNIPLRKWRGYAPVYEQPPRQSRRGKPYDHLLQLRSDKMIHWLRQVPLVLSLGGFLVVRYEDILREGNTALLQQVAIILNTTAVLDCPIVPPQPHRLGQRFIPEDFREWIQQHMDVTTERMIGYI